MSKPQVKFHQKILTLSGRKSSDRVSHLGTIRGHLGLNRCLLMGARIVNVVNERQKDDDTRGGNGAKKGDLVKFVFRVFKVLTMLTV